MKNLSIYLILATYLVLCDSIVAQFKDVPDPRDQLGNTYKNGQINFGLDAKNGEKKKFVLRSAYGSSSSLREYNYSNGIYAIHLASVDKGWHRSKKILLNINILLYDTRYNLQVQTTLRRIESEKAFLYIKYSPF